MAKGKLDLQVLRLLMILHAMKKHEGVIKMSDITMTRMLGSERHSFYRLLKALEKNRYVLKDGKIWVATDTLRKLLGLDCTKSF